MYKRQTYFKMVININMLPSLASKNTRFSRTGYTKGQINLPIPLILMGIGELTNKTFPKMLFFPKIVYL